MQAPSALSNVSVVLVDTRTAENIGAVARVMMNMGLSRLVLVRPPHDRDEGARKLAAGAGQILDAAVEYSCLRDAVSGLNLVIGVSRHRGRLRRNVQTPREAAADVLPLLSSNTVALVFGNEVNGLDREDLALCHEFIAIPSSDAFPSLNLSHAVMVVAYEFLVAAQGPVTPDSAELAVQDELEQFYAHLEATLREIGFLDGGQPDRIMFSMRQLFGRTRLDSREVSMLRGILRNVGRTRNGSG